MHNGGVGRFSGVVLGSSMSVIYRCRVSSTAAIIKVGCVRISISGM